VNCRIQEMLENNEEKFHKDLEKIQRLFLQKDFREQEKIEQKETYCVDRKEFLQEIGNYKKESPYSILVFEVLHVQEYQVPACEVL